MSRPPQTLEASKVSKVDKQRSSTLPQSEFSGVHWHAQKGKWVGAITNPLKRTASGGGKQEYTSLFVNENECINATNALRARVQKEYDDTTAAWAEADPLTRGLPRAPDDWTQAEKGVVYWKPNPQDNHKPIRVLKPTTVQKDGGERGRHCDGARGGKVPTNASGGHGVRLPRTPVPTRQGSVAQDGARWHRACNHLGCTKQAQQAVQGGKLEFCREHGGKCPHGHDWQMCRTCNPNITKNAACCSVCGQCLDKKRRECYGGNKLCTHCEHQQGVEAAASGSAPPPKGKRTEDVVLDELETLVVDEQGRVIKCEMRDDMSYMLGSNKRRRKGECDTEHQRRPDMLYVKRNCDGYIVAALFVEVDEHSHTDRDSACEAGKIDESFQALLAIAQKEGKGRLAETRKGRIRTPNVFFLKLNPDACDAPGGIIPRKKRIQELARLCMQFLNTSAADFEERSDRGECMVPHVMCMYYHSKQGGKHLDYFQKHACDTGAWNFEGNWCDV